MRLPQLQVIWAQGYEAYEAFTAQDYPGQGYEASTAQAYEASTASTAAVCLSREAGLP